MKILQYVRLHIKNSVTQVVHCKIFHFLRYAHFRYAKCLFAKIQKQYAADTDVFKTSSGRLEKVTTSYDQTRRRHNVLQKTSDLRRLEDVRFTSSWRHPIYDVLMTSDLRRLEDVRFTMSWRRLIYVVLKTSIYVFLKTSDLRCLEDIWLTTSWRRLIYDVLKTSVKRRLP